MAKPQSSAYRETLFAVGGFVLGAVCAGGFMLLVSMSQTPDDVHALRQSSISSADKYQFVDPLLAISSSQTDSPQYADLERAVSDYIDAQRGNGLTAASVNVRDLEASQGFVINESELYSPASLYKVPLMLAYYNLAETDPSILDVKLTYGGDNQDATENIKSNVQLAAGHSYTAEELIEHMIKYSDNNAVVLLKGYLDQTHPSALADTLGTLGVPYGTTSDFLKVDTYSIFFRVLYNATYLTPEYSEKALDLLTQSDFTEGIEAGVPNSIDVAHKFGDSNHLTAQNQPDGYELHDCGVVYYPGHPYLLCVMTKGQTISRLEAVLAGVSRIVYQNMERRY